MFAWPAPATGTEPYVERAPRASRARCRPTTVELKQLVARLDRAIARADGAARGRSRRAASTSSSTRRRTGST
ncbi:MAG: hypothetical protein MZV70_43405 [Desulfobacterales bacterium]|nr:hypothetical protein [Desulfobacterales bacterium]